MPAFAPPGSHISHRNKRAVGIEYVQNPKVHPNASNEVLVAKAKRLVVVSAGSFGSPGILERSGIGAKAVLEKAGVDVLVELSGVGENYQGVSRERLCPMRCVLTAGTDHQVIFTPYLASENSETIDGIVRNEEVDFESAQLPLLRSMLRLINHFK